MKTGILTVPTVRVDGRLYRDASVILRPDGTWTLLAITPPTATTNAVCGVSRKQAEEDLREYETERFTPNFSLIEYSVSSGMEDYDIICSWAETPKLLEILEDRAQDFWPSFGTIRYAAEQDIAAIK
jgi:hypothetical protein